MNNADQSARTETRKPKVSYRAKSKDSPSSSNDRSSSGERSRSDDRPRSGDRSRSNDRSRSGSAERSNDRSGSGDRSRSNDRSSSGDRSRSNDRSSSGDRSRSNDRSSSGDRSRSNDRSRSGDRSRSNDRSRSGDRSRSNNQGRDKRANFSRGPAEDVFMSAANQDDVDTSSVTFADLKLNEDLLPALEKLGYEKPTPVQARAIPPMLEGGDVLGQAQTGTGKTAAFALPILSRVEIDLRQPQALIIVPTRELAMQITEEFKKYSRGMNGLFTLPVYGGKDFAEQLKGLKRGSHIVVGTPGRMMDQMRRGILKLDEIKTVVLDEADEMLKMGFVDDITWILEQISQDHQTALFSATMPQAIRRIADKYLKNPTQVVVKAHTQTTSNIEQFYTLSRRNEKQDILFRILKIEKFDAAIIFTSTKSMSSELADKLKSQGYRAAAINGDLQQTAREQVVRQMKQGRLDIIVATEVASRGLDIDRIELVVNYDVPSNVDNYVHRIGRTGRAGRSGKALILLTFQEKYFVNNIKRFAKQDITELTPPSDKEIREKNMQNFSDKIIETLNSGNLNHYRKLVSKIASTNNIEEIEVAAALACIAGEQLPV